MSRSRTLIAIAICSVAAPVQAQVEAFYEAPATLPLRPGILIRAEPLKKNWVPKSSVAYRILYSTTTLDNKIGVASGVVLVPVNATGTSPRSSNVIAWAHGTTGIDEASAPALQKDGLASGGMFISQQVIDAGWSIVATDYVGLGTKGPHQYLVGVPAARAVLDAVRAAHSLNGVALRNENVVWGHSQGGAVALWTGIVAPEYAPDVKIDGVAAFAPATYPIAILKYTEKGLGGSVLASYAITGYSNTYPDVRITDYIRPDAISRVKDMASHGLSSPSTIIEVLKDKVHYRPIWQRDPATGPFARHLIENIPDKRIAAPVLLAQGTNDETVPPASNKEFVDVERKNGTSIDYQEFAKGHVDLVQEKSPLIPYALSWTSKMFNGMNSQSSR